MKSKIKGFDLKCIRGKIIYFFLPPALAADLVTLPDLSTLVTFLMTPTATV